MRENSREKKKKIDSIVSNNNTSIIYDVPVLPARTSAINSAGWKWIISTALMVARPDNRLKIYVGAPANMW